MARKNNASEEYPSFDFEPLPPEPVQQVEVEKNELGKGLEMPAKGSVQKGAYSGPKLIEKNDECQYCGHLFESESSCEVCVSDKEKRDYLKGLKAGKIENKIVPIALTELETIMERLRNDPRNDGIKNNDNALLAKAKIIASTKPGTSYETTPWPPLDN